METLQHIPVPAPCAAGVDRRSDVSDIDALAAVDLNNLDLVAAGAGTRLRPRGWLKRWSRRALGMTYVLGETGTLPEGTYKYAYAYTDGDGIEHYSFTYTVTVTAPKDEVTVSNWPTSAGTVKIFRTAVGEQTLKLLKGPLDVTVHANYTDDGSDELGSEEWPDTDVLDPLGNDSFDQTALCDFLILHHSLGESGRVINANLRTGGLGSSSVWCYCWIGYDVFSQYGWAGTAEDPYDWALLGDYVWIAVAGSALRYAVSAVQSVPTLSQPSITNVTEVSVGTGNLNPSTGYQWVTQLEHVATGVRSTPSEPYPSSPWTPGTPPSNAQLTLSAPGSGKKHHIYRTSDGGQYFQYVGESETTSYTDDTVDTGLSQETVPFEVGGAVGFKHIMAHRGLLVVANKQSSPKALSLLRWSSALWPHNFPNDALIAPEYEFQVDPEDGDEISGMWSWGSIGMIFKRRRVYMLIGDPPTNFTYRPLEGSRGMGCEAFRTIADTPAGLFYLSKAGVCRIPAPGMPPELVSDPISEVFVEPQRTAAEQGAADSMMFALDNLDAETENFHLRLQWATDAAFSNVVCDLQTDNASERGRFKAGGAAWPAGGLELGPGQSTLVTAQPAGLTGGATYYVRGKAFDYYEWSDWGDLGTFTPPYDDESADVLNWERAVWAFALHYPPRKEYWLFLPTGSRAYCDVCWVLNYGALRKGGAPVWRKHTIAATAGCVINDMELGGARPQTYMLLAGPDGLLYVYPYMEDGYDCDTGVSVEPRLAAATRSVPPDPGVELTVSTATWTTDRYGLAGNVVVARDQADGSTYTGLIRANTATTLDVVWLQGRTPPGGTFDIAIGGVETLMECGWLQLGGDYGHAAIVRQIALHTSGETARVSMTLRGAKSARRPAANGPKRRRDVSIGEGYEQVRRQIDIRGHVHQLCLRDYLPEQAWELQGFELAIEAPGAR